MAGAQRIRFQNGAASLNGNAVSEKAKAFQIFYDSNRQMFLAPNSRDGWIVITTPRCEAMAQRTRVSQ
jgi:hypothetical protein